MNRFFKVVTYVCAGGFIYFFALSYGQTNLASAANISMMILAGGIFANELIIDDVAVPKPFQVCLGICVLIVAITIFFLLPSYVLNSTAMFILTSLIGFTIGVILRRVGWLFVYPHN